MPDAAVDCAYLAVNALCCQGTGGQKARASAFYFAVGGTLLQ